MLDGIHLEIILLDQITLLIPGPNSTGLVPNEIDVAFVLSQIRQGTHFKQSNAIEVFSQNLSCSRRNRTRLQ